MAKMIPDFIDQEDPRRNGERMVFDWFSNRQIPGTVYYSLLQKNHKRKFIGEIDFLYVTQRGLICIEVKGGQDIYRNDREWYSVNMRGKHNKIHNPFIQAKDCQYALKDYLVATYGRESEQANYLVGYAVIFPECKFTGTGNDLVTEVLFDGRYNISDFTTYLDKVYDYWEQLEINRHGFVPRKLTSVQLTQINDLLRGDFHVVPSMHLELQHVEQKMVQLTREQYGILDIVEDNPRVIVQGGAGTGKTLLAIELARKNAAKGGNILYLCYNRNMSDYARMSLDGCRNIKVKTYHSLLMEELSESGKSTASAQELSNNYIKSVKDSSNVYDLIIIDEGQDLFFPEVFDVLDKMLYGGLEKGMWVIFLDPNQNIFNGAREYEQTMEYVRELYNPVSLPLRTNCRNTQPIASRTAALTVTPPAKNLKLSGPKVITRPYKNQEQFLELFTQELQSLLISGIAAEDIVLLSRYKKENSQLAKISKRCNLCIEERNDIKTFKKRCLNYFTVQSFKGLESKIIFYIDVDGFSTTRDRMLNYVAMSRAKLHLYLFYDVSKKQDYQDTIDKGRELLE